MTPVGFRFSDTDLKASIGSKCDKLSKKYHCCEAVGPVELRMQAEIEKIAKLFEDNSEYLDEKEKVIRELTIGSYLIGIEPYPLTPAVVILCRSKRVRRKAVKLIKKELPELERLGIKIKERAQAPYALATSQIASMLSLIKSIRISQDPKYCDYIIRAHTTDRANVIRRANIGGLVQINDDIYGLTVAHFLTPFPVKAPQRPAGSDCDDSGNQSSDGALSDSTGSSDSGEERHTRDGSPHSLISSGTQSVELRESPDAGSNPSGSESTTGALVHTGVGPRASMVSSGSIIPSSSETSASDWALVRLEDTFLNSGALSSYKIPWVRDLLTESPERGSIVHLCKGPTMWAGKFTGGTTYMRLPGLSKFQRLSVIEFGVSDGRPIENGDSGAWVLRGDLLCGILIAGLPEKSQGLMLRADAIFEQISSQMKAPAHIFPLGVPLGNLLELLRKHEIHSELGALLSKMPDTRAFITMNQATDSHELESSSYEAIQQNSAALINSILDLCNTIRIRQSEATSTLTWAELRPVLEQALELRRLVVLLQSTFNPDIMFAFRLLSQQGAGIPGILEQTVEILDLSRQSIELLRDLIRSAVDQIPKPTATDVEGYHPLQQDHETRYFENACNQLKCYHGLLKLSLTVINILGVHHSEQGGKGNATYAMMALHDLGLQFESQVSALCAVLKTSPRKDTKIPSIAVKFYEDITAAIPLLQTITNINKYWGLPRSVNSDFIGRKQELQELKEMYLASTASKGEKSRSENIFVIHGLGGSGKTEFCYKFAQENRHRFWGVFWVDASSKERASSTWTDIAVLGNLPKEASGTHRAKNWLSQSGLPWLLIIDNADDNGSDYTDLFPNSDKGFILMTTRDHGLRYIGTVGTGSFQFEGLELEDAQTLLLKSAAVRTPWEESTLQVASDVSRELGCLPLALAHAGAAIRTGLCTLKTYLEYQNMYLRRWNHQRVSRTTFSDKLYTSSSADIGTAFEAYEVILKGLETGDSMESRDAWDLVNILAFFDRKDIPIDVFIRAATNRAASARARRQPASEEIERLRVMKGRQNQSAVQILRQMMVYVQTMLLEPVTMTNFPAMLRGADEDRIRVAFQELQRMSFITRTEREADAVGNITCSRYSMHPLVHTWVRKRPGSSLGQQAIWCYMAAEVMAESLQLEQEISGNKTMEEETYRQGIYLHIVHVHQYQDEIEQDFLSNQRSKKWRIFSPLQHTMNRERMLQLVKFSIVYRQAGQLETAERMQREALDFVNKRLGPENIVTMRLQLLLSLTVCWLGHIHEAAELQQQILEDCLKILGQEDPMTWKTHDLLGVTRRLQGRFVEARELHKFALEGFKRLQPGAEDDINTLRAMKNLGAVYLQSCDYEKAAELLHTAADGLAHILSPESLDAIDAQDGLAMTYLEMALFDKGGQRMLERGYELELKVLARYGKRLGDQHPSSLLAKLNLAHMIATQGRPAEAESRVREAITMTEADGINMRKADYALAFGKTLLTHVVFMQGKQEEARVIFQQAIEEYEKNEQFGKPTAMSTLTHSYMVEDDLDQAQKLRSRIISTLRATGMFSPRSVECLLDPTTLSDYVERRRTRPIFSESERGQKKLEKYADVEDRLRKSEVSSDIDSDERSSLKRWQVENPSRRFLSPGAEATGTRDISERQKPWSGALIEEESGEEDSYSHDASDRDWPRPTRNQRRRSSLGFQRIAEGIEYL